MRPTRLAFLALAALALAPAAHSQQPGGPNRAVGQVDRLDAALDRRLSGQAGLDDVRIEASWRRASEIVSSRVYGDGVGIWNEKTQFSLTHEQVLGLVRTLRDARFGAMARAYGAEEGGEEGEEEREREKEKEKQKEKVYLRGFLAVRVGTDTKRVAQYMEGEQEAALTRLIDRVLSLSEKAAKNGVGAASLSDGLEKLADGKLAPETLQMVVQRTDRPGEGDADGSWVLRIDGRRVLDRSSSDEKKGTVRLLVLSGPEFRTLAKLLRDSNVSGLPNNLYSPEYVRLNVHLLNARTDLTARRYAGKTARTLGEKQAAFDRVYAALLALHRRAEKEGAAAAETAE